jgi:hypothetical protein
MKGYVFDPSRLRGSPKEQGRRGYAMAARMLREHLGGDPRAEARRRAQRDPMLRAMFAMAARKDAEPCPPAG